MTLTLDISSSCHHSTCYIAAFDAQPMPHLSSTATRNVPHHLSLSRLPHMPPTQTWVETSQSQLKKWRKAWAQEKSKNAKAEERLVS